MLNNLDRELDCCLGRDTPLDRAQRERDVARHARAGEGEES